MRISKFGLLLIIIGIFLLLSTYNISVFQFSRDWPWILVIVGLFLLLKRGNRCSNPFININTNGKSKSEEKKESANRKEILEKLHKNEITLEEAMKKMNGEE
ncbi:MAG: DUF5668 domain-containing protein [bacterium]